MSEIAMKANVVTGDDYNNFLSTMALPDEPLFLTGVELWPIYLDSFADPDDRQYHNCHACRQFIKRVGTLVTIDEQGLTHSAVWKPENAPERYLAAIIAMKNSVENARVYGVFLSSARVLGTPVTNQWTHYAVANPRVYSRETLKTPFAAAASKKEDFKTICRALASFKLETLEQVVDLLRLDALYRSEKILGQAEWLYELKRAVENMKHRQRRRNIIWRAIASAPDGFCHPRSGMIGTLLDDLDNGLELADAARRFESKMHPLAYQRPQAMPSEGAIDAAEKAIKKMGVERSLERRFATMDGARGQHRG